MALNYDNYLSVLAESCKRAYADLAKKQTDIYVVKASKATQLADYTTGIAVPYEEWREKLTGQFFLGLTDPAVRGAQSGCFRLDRPAAIFYNPPFTGRTAYRPPSRARSSAVRAVDS